ncbi:hypothetical protein ACJMK2_017292 [Sinanodonta woodiana]|uniref:Alpha-carbonic anhydrase domain-containing protein n=1 Tax=Sinanodonta woodiana TaxID=1069815 RepID=A0ABD3UWE8_SINWO
MLCNWITRFLDILFFSLASAQTSIWSNWWTYDGISGPRYWGLNPEWILCQVGKYQSPIDILPEKLLYDPALTTILFPSKKMNGNLTNTGHDVTFHVEEDLMPHFNVTSGPLQYEYRIYQIKIHFGHSDVVGSEHLINGLSFPAEVQIMAYNADLCDNFTQALITPNGLAIFAIFAEIGPVGNEAFTILADNLKYIPSKGQSSWISGLPLVILLPRTTQYMTYEGSTTQPGCHETVTWVIFNKPIYVLKEQMLELRKLNQKGGSDQQLLIEGNVRPAMPLNNRVIRTNIKYENKIKNCTVTKEVFYEVNTLRNDVRRKREGR